MDLVRKNSLVLCLVLSSFGVIHAGLLSVVGNIVSNVTSLINNTVAADLSTLDDYLNGVVVNNLITLEENAGVLDPSCNAILIESICPNPNVTFWLYTNTTDAYQLKEYDADNLRSAPFISGVPVDILIHGYTGNKSWTPNTQARPPYLSKGHNVISLDYSPAAVGPCYIEAVTNFPTVANCTARFILALLQYTNITAESIHITGHSLGSQVGGLTGTLLTTANPNLQPKRMTGLDPAGPLFWNHSYVQSNSANFVEAIHTNIFLSGEVYSGADINFYMNNGVLQPACNGDISCSHEISAAYYGEAINSSINPTKGFYGYPAGAPCTISSLVLMGPYTPPRNYTPNIYIVNTNSTSPYAVGPVCSPL